MILVPKPPVAGGNPQGVYYSVSIYLGKLILPYSPSRRLLKTFDSRLQLETALVERAAAYCRWHFAHRGYNSPSSLGPEPSPAGSGRIAPGVSS